MSTTKSSLVILGTNRLAQDWIALSKARGLDAELASDAAQIQADAALVIETSAGDEAMKRRLRMNVLESY